MEVVPNHSKSYINGIVANLSLLRFKGKAIAIINISVKLRDISDLQERKSNICNVMQIVSVNIFIEYYPKGYIGRPWPAF